MKIIKNIEMGEINVKIEEPEGSDLHRLLPKSLYRLEFEGKDAFSSIPRLSRHGRDHFRKGIITLGLNSK